MMGGALYRGGKARFPFAGCEEVEEKGAGVLAAGGWGKPPVFNSLVLATKLCLCVDVEGVPSWNTEEEEGGGMRESITTDGILSQ